MDKNKPIFSKDIFPSWDEISASFLVGMMNSFGPETFNHVAKCSSCSDKTSPLLQECYKIMITDNPQLHKKLEEIILIIGTHMGLDPTKFPKGFSQ